MPTSSSQLPLSLARPFTKVVGTCVFILLLATSLAAQITAPTKGAKMINVEAIAKALMIPDATVTSVAQTIGALGDTCGDCYLVKSNDSRLRDVEIGVKDQKNDPNVAPTYVQLYFAPGQAVSLAETAPFCKHWRWMPNGVHSTPNFYACDYEKSPQVWVTLFAELSGDIDAPSSHLDGLLLQRNLL